MHFNSFKQYAYVISLLCVFVLAWLIQSSLLLNTDVSYLLEASRQMLSGGHYATDFFENNPPWILYFYSLPVLFSTLLSVNIIISIQLYVFLLATISLNLCFYFFKQLFVKHDAFLAHFLLVILSILFLILPMNEFGQREHLLFVLMMPYLLMVAQRLENQSIATPMACFIGLLAGSALMIKPYFFVTLLLVEGYYFIFSRYNFCTWKRPELSVILLLLIVYMAIVFLWHTDYLRVVLPFSLRWFYLGTRRPWIILLSNLPTLYCFVPFLIYIATYKKHRYRSLSHVLLLSLLGYIFSYFVQQVDWRYHLLT